MTSNEQDLQPQPTPASKTSADMIDPSGPPVKLREGRFGVRTQWKPALLAYLEAPALGGKGFDARGTGPWATFKAYPFGYGALARLKRTYGRFGWEFSITHRCPHCGEGRREHKTPATHAEKCRWRDMASGRIWISFRRTFVGAETAQAGLEYLKRRRNPRTARAKESE